MKNGKWKTVKIFGWTLANTRRSSCLGNVSDGAGAGVAVLAGWPGCLPG